MHYSTYCESDQLNTQHTEAVITNFFSCAFSILLIVGLIFVFFFFSSRRRHTRYWRDWSSDVCSSDLHPIAGVSIGESHPHVLLTEAHAAIAVHIRAVQPPVPARGVGDGPMRSGYLEIGRASCRERV